MKQHGGKRQGAGRPRSTVEMARINIRIKREYMDIIKQHAEIAQCSVNELASQSIIHGEMRAYAHMLSMRQSK